MSAPNPKRSSSITSLSRLGKKKKPSWDDGYGRNLSAGGILFYDETGIWVIGEKTKSGIEYSDFGGSYNRDDGDIYQTISRELTEESYLSIDITRRQLMDMVLSKLGQPRISRGVYKTYVNNHANEPTYICFIVPVWHAEQYGIQISQTKFIEGYNYIINHNADNSDYYRIAELRHLPYHDLIDNFTSLSFRLRKILKHTSYFSHPSMKKFLSNSN
jgi:hypothetical protein